MSSGRYLVIFTEPRGKYPRQATDTEENNCFSENSEIIEHKKDYFKVARYSFSRPIPPKFENKLGRHKQSFGKIATTVVLDKDENLL